jgi:hypothetical protein
MKTRRKPKRRFTAPGLSEQQRQAEVRRVLAPSARTILYYGKLVPNRDSPRAVARYLAEELRASPWYGARSLMRIVELRWNVKGFVPKMLKALDKCLKDGQPMFDKMDYDIVSIVEQHPLYTIKEITAALAKQYPKRKFDTLEKRVRRLVKNVPR